jgi:hypothetical protein
MQRKQIPKAVQISQKSPAVREPADECPVLAGACWIASACLLVSIF